MIEKSLHSANPDHKHNQPGRIAPVIFLIILFSFLFFAVTIRPGHDWGDDFSLYILHAGNIAEGRPYSETGYLYNRLNPEVAPRNYPPVLPLSLAPLYRLFGLNLELFKLVIVVYFSASLIITYLLFQPYLHRACLILLVAVLAFSPFFWVFKDKILSDVPYLFFCLLVLLAVNKFYGSRYTDKLPAALLTGLAFYLAYATRTVGVVLPLAFLFFVLLKYKRISGSLVVSLLVFALLALLQNAFTGGSNSYLDNFNLSLPLILKNAVLYFRDIASFWDDGYLNLFRPVLFTLFLGLAPVGYLHRLKNNPGIFEIFMPLHILTVLVWPSFQASRLFIPVMPLFLFYALVGMGAILDGIKKYIPARLLFIKEDLPGAVSVVLGILIFGTFLIRYSVADYGPLPEGVHKVTSLQLFSYIKNTTAPEDRLLFIKPKALALYTGRQVSAYHDPERLEQLWSYLDQQRIKYIVLNKVAIDGSNQYTYLGNFINNYREQLELKFQNQDFELFLISAPHYQKATERV